MQSEINCPKCGSTQITANKKGFSGGKAVAGAVLTGGIGLLAGTIGSNKIVITCLSCGNQFKPGDTHKKPSEIKYQTFKNEQTPTEKRKAGIVLLVFFGALTITCFLIGWNFIAWIFLVFSFFGLITALSKQKT